MGIKTLPPWARWIGIMAVGGGFMAIWVQVAQQGLASLCVFVLLCVAALRLWYVAGRPGHHVRPDVWAVPALALCIVLGLGLLSSSRFMKGEDTRSNRAQFKAMAEWYQGVATPDDKMLVTLPWIVGYYSQLSDEYFVATELLESLSVDGLVEELRARGVTYLVLDSDYYDPGYWSYFYKVPLLHELMRGAGDTLQVALWVSVGSKWAIVYRFQAPESA